SHVLYLCNRTPILNINTPALHDALPILGQNQNVAKRSHTTEAATPHTQRNLTVVVNSMSRVILTQSLWATISSGSSLNRSASSSGKLWYHFFRASISSVVHSFLSYFFKSFNNVCLSI